MKCVLLLSFVCAFGTCYAQTTSQPEGKRFNVDDVKIAPGPLTEIKAQFAFENELNREVLFFPDELTDETAVPAWGNNFVATIHTSFDEHRPLSLTPDAIWLVIAQGVSIHINENFDQLESHIFKADKPDKIKVRNDNLTEGAAHWVDLMHAFSDSTTKYVNDDYYSFFVPEFSTTTNIHMTSYEVTMLEGFSQAFEYFGDSGCGIPYITLQGTREDWQSIYDRLDKVEELGMELWAAELRLVIQQFINVFDDNVNLNFWQSIYKDHSEYGAWYVSGWFIKFFPYLEGTGKSEDITEEGREYYARAPKIYVPNNYLEGDRYLISRLNTSDFPSGMSEITVHWNNWGTDQEMKVHAGFYGIKQYDDLSLEPAIAWAVRDENASEANHDYTRKRYEIEKKPVYWLPHALSNDRLKEFAIYGSTSQSDSLESNLILEIKILTELEKNPSFSEDNLKGKTVELLISSKGTFLECRGEGVDTTLLDEINVIVKNLPKKWEPAKADFREFVYDFYDEEDDGRIVLVPANSWYKLTF
ncbi:MAG: DUF4419 domain-containing protein [Crocinitomicaceae bacterium]